MILAINTTTLQFSIALLQEDETILAECSASRKKGHFGRFMPAVDFLFSTVESDMGAVAAVAVATGPGSFTGLRVGLSAAKGLCHALEVPIIGISSLRALAAQMPYSDVSVTPILDSRRREYFAAQFDWRNSDHLKRRVKDFCAKLEDFPTYFQEPTLFVGNDFPRQAALIKEVMGRKVLLAPAHLWTLKASAVGHLGLMRYLAGDFDDPGTLKPQYMRPPPIRKNPFPLSLEKDLQLNG
jgi:tRNA threonylcarbamoyladenosine biosynthesis protein TsaB